MTVGPITGSQRMVFLLATPAAAGGGDVRAMCGSRFDGWTIRESVHVCNSSIRAKFALPVRAEGVACGRVQKRLL